MVFVLLSLLISWLVAERKRSEDALRVARDELEHRVLQRTTELSTANRDLEVQIAERKETEQRILAYQMRLQSLAAELAATEERERRRIATVLHDAIGHSLAVALIKLKAMLTGHVSASTI